MSIIQSHYDDMKDLKIISRIFLLKSKALTISCISSIGIAIILIISMWNLTENAKISYENKLHAAYGDFDAILSYEDYSEIPDNVVEDIHQLEGIDKFSAGYFDPNFMIEDNNVYLVGSDNSNLMKSRYHYKNDIQHDEIVVNKVLASVLKCKKGNNITANGLNLRVSEILEDNTGGAASITMAIVNLDTLTTLLGKTPGNKFILLRFAKDHKQKETIEDIQLIDVQLRINMVETDEVYKVAMESLTIFINALMVCVIIVTAMFVTSNMKRFIYKYNHDLAIIRAIGGRKEQVKRIFRYIILYIAFLGCAGGFVISIFFNKLIVGWLNREIHLIDGKIQYDFISSLMIAATCFFVLVLILLLSIQKSFKILPLEAFMQNELSQIGKRKKSRKRSGIFLISKVFGKDTYITLKLMFVRFKENLLITATIMMIVVISFLGNSLFNLMSYTNDIYYKEYFLTDTVVTSSSSILYKDFAKYYELLQNTDGLDASIVLWARFEATYNNEPLRFVIADFDAMERQGILKNSSKDENRIVLSKKLAEKYNITTGDYINVLTPPKYILDSYGRKQGISEKPYEVRMCVTAIIGEYMFNNSDAYIDIKCNDFMQNDCYFSTVYINGDLNTSDQLLTQLKNIHTGLKWESYDNMMAISHKALKERYIMFEIVVGILTLIAGLGWFNAIRYTLLSRTKEYDILRINGMTVRRLRRMLFVHIAIYLCIGIVLGVLVGMGAFAWITYLDGGKSIVVINLRSFALISSYLILLCMLLIPDILKISKEKVITNE